MQILQSNVIPSAVIHIFTKVTHKPNDHGDYEHEDYEMAAPVQPNFKGVHKSGYHSSVSDQYAAIVTPKKPRTTVTRKFSVHERIQVLMSKTLGTVYNIKTCRR